MTKLHIHTMRSKGKPDNQIVPGPVKDVRNIPDIVSVDRSVHTVVITVSGSITGQKRATRLSLVVHHMNHQQPTNLRLQRVHF